MIEGAGGATLPPAIQQLFDAIGAVRTRPQAGLSHEQVAEELVWLRQADDLLQLACAETVRSYTASCPSVDEDTHPVGFLRCECRDATKTAVNLTTVAEHLDTLHASVRALESGRIGFDHLALLAETLERVLPHGRWDAELEARLLRRAEHRNVTRFRRDCLHVQHSADAEGFLREQQEGVEQASLEISGGHSGAVWLRGIFPADTGAMVRTALEALAGKRGLADERPRSSRLAHALVELCEPRPGRRPGAPPRRRPAPPAGHHHPGDVAGPARSASG